MSVFPPEICDLIIDYLANRRRSLARCGLVSRSWVTRSQYHLFETVTLRARNIPQFLLFLQSQRRPTWLPFIKRFCYTFELELSDPMFPHDTPPPRLREILDQLPSLPAVKFLYLSGMQHQGYLDRMDFPSISNTFPNILGLDLRQADFLESVHLFELLSSFRSLQTLSLHDILWDEYTLDPRDPSSPVPQILPRPDPNEFPQLSSSLNSLHLHLPWQASVILFWLWFHPRPVRLHKLSVMFCDIDDLELFEEFCMHFGEDIEDLELVMDVDDPTRSEMSVQVADFFREASFSSLTKLKRLSVHTISCNGGGDMWICELLKAISIPHPLEVLTLGINNDERPSEDQNHEYFNSLNVFDFDALRDIFLLPQYCALQKLNFSVTYMPVIARATMEMEFWNSPIRGVMSTDMLASKWEMDWRAARGMPWCE